MSISHFPAVRGTRPGNENHDPMHASLFEVILTVPGGIPNASSIPGLTQYVTTVSGLDALQKTPAAGQQKFLGGDLSYLNPTLDNTYAEFTVEFNLNLTELHASEVFNVFKAWQKINYNLANGERMLKKFYVAPTVTIKEANRDGTVWRKVDFFNVMMTACTGLDALDYTNNEARKLTVTFRADWWNETITNEDISGLSQSYTKQSPK